MNDIFLSLASIVLLGNVLQRLYPDWNLEDLRKSINKLVLHVLLPALIFKVITSSELGGVLYEVPLCIGAGIIGCVSVGWVIFRFFSIARPAQGALILACAFGNVTYLGLPVLQGVFPDYALDISKVAILSEVTVSPLNLVVGSLLAMRYGADRGVGVRQSLKQVCQLPPLWALAVALGCKFLQVPVPSFIQHAAGVLGATVSGLMILSLGMAIKFQRVEHPVPLLAAGSIKLLLSPLVVFFAARALGMKPPYFEAVTLEGAMPTQLLTLVIADRFNLDSKLLAQVILINTVIAFVTLPLLRGLLF